MPLIHLTRPAEPSVPRSERRSTNDVLGVEGGASPQGSTFWKRLRRCPREARLYELGLRKTGGGSEALDTGLVFHHALEAYYRSRMAGTRPVLAEPDAWGAIHAILKEPGYEETYAVVERLLTQYFEQYRHTDDADWKILAVEETLSYEGAFRYSARLDLVIEDQTGLWVVEHKTAKTVTADLITGYQQDMQILGQVWLLQNCVDLTAYAPLQGVRVNIATKHVVPRFHRIDVMPSRYHLGAFEESMRAHQALHQAFSALDWPRFLGNCTGPTRFFGTCDYYDLCHGHPQLGADAWAEDLPFGFVNVRDGEEA